MASITSVRLQSAKPVNKILFHEVEPRESLRFGMTGASEADKAKVALLVEDNAAERRAIQGMIERCGFTVVSAVNGRDGLKKCRGLKPDVVFLDLNLPDIDGFGVMKQLQADRQTSRIPVFCITGVTDPAELLKSASLGLKACGYIRKPFDDRRLRTEIRRGLALRERELKGDRAPRKVPLGPQRILRRGLFTVDLLSRRVLIGELQTPTLGTREFVLLCVLMDREGPVLREELHSRISHQSYAPQLVDTVVWRLRDRLSRFGAEGVIGTVKHGYIFLDPKE